MKFILILYSHIIYNMDYVCYSLTIVLDLNPAANYRITSLQRDPLDLSEYSLLLVRARVSQNFSKRRKVCTIAKPVFNITSDSRRDG